MSHCGLTLVLGILVALPACDSGSVQTQSCTRPDDCPTGKTCLNGVCVALTEAGLPFPDGGSEAGPCQSGVSCGATCCGSGQFCAYSTCVDDQGACTADKDCLDDTYCDNGKCIPWGIGPKGDRNQACTYLVPIGQSGTSAMRGGCLKLANIDRFSTCIIGSKRRG